MPNPAKQIVLGTALLVGITTVTNADPLPPTGDKSTALRAAVPSGARQLSGNEASALPPSDAKPTRESTKLPGVSVVAPPYSHPYTSRIGPKVSPNGRVRAEHYQAPPDYVTNIAMHPYASGVGPKAGPNRAWRFEHYEVTAEYKADVSKHPYTSGFGVPPEGGRNRPGDLQGVKRLNDKALPGTGG
jgi:hypothetical protein